MMSKLIVNSNPLMFLDTDAPTVEAERIEDSERVLWRITCPYCGERHHHGPGPGLRVAHCPGAPASLGYNVAPPGGWQS